MRRILLSVLVAVPALLALSCDDAFGPRGLIRVEVAPRYAALPQAVENPAAFVDNVRIRLERNGALLTDTVIVWPADQDTLEAEVEVQVLGGGGALGYLIQARTGDVVVFESSGTVDLGSNPGGDLLLDPELEYTGEGALATSITLAEAPATGNGNAEVAHV